MELNTSWILQFLQNVCLFAAIVLCYREIIRAARNERQRTLLLGLLFGAGAAVGMMLPVTVTGNEAFDAGLLPIGLSGVFGGPVAAIIAAFVAGAFRIASHHYGLGPLAEAIIAAAVSIGFYQIRMRRREPVTISALLLFGAAVALATGAASWFVHPDLAAATPIRFAIFVLGGGIGGTLVLGSLLSREDRILAQERAHAQESKMLDAVLESMSDGLLAVDTSGKFVVFNRPAQQMLGDWRGDKLDSWLTNYKRFHLDGKTPVAAEELALPRALKGLETNDLNLVVRSPHRPDGFVVSVNGRPLRDDQGIVVAGITVVRDVSELISAQRRLAESEAALKQSEERYALAFEGAYDGLWDRDLRTGKAFFSARCFEIVGLQRTEHPTGRMVDYDWWANRIHPEDALRVLEAVEDALKSGAPSFEIEYRIRRINGTYCWISDRGAISRDAVRHAYRLAGSVTDISARKLAEEHRRMLESQLQVSQKTEALGTLAGGIAHDINNTLIPIIGIVDMMLQDTPEDGDLGENLQDVMAAAVKIKELVRQILAFSRHETADREDVDPGTEVRNALRMLRAMVPATISLEFQSRLSGAACKVNTTQLHQVIMNLVSNAVGAIGAKRGAIRIALDRLDVVDPAAITGEKISARSFCRLTFIDTGPGIPPKISSRLFDPFFTTKPVGEGTGLGLSVVQGIVRDHDGFVLVSNEPGAGARFDVHLPLVEQAPVRSAAAE